jgi:hypothetical protein
MTTTPAVAEPSLIKSPGDHPPYHVELEPHALVGYGAFENGALGAGLRANIKLVDPGFISTLNDTVALSLGADFFLGYKRANVAYLPVQLQWNFFFTQHWSAGGEAGASLQIGDVGDRNRIWPIVSAVGRYHFNERISLTLRVGFPAVSLGVSFFL